MHLEKIKELCSGIFKTLWMPSVSFCCRLAVGTEVDSRFNHAALASKGRHSPVMMLDISLLYILLLSLLSLPASPIISPSFHRHQLQVYCQAQSVGEEVHWRILQIRPQGSHCITFSYFSVQGKWYPIYFFCVVVCFSWSLFSVLCYVILSLSLSLSLSLALWASAVGSVAVWVPLFLVVDAESGYPVGDEKEKEHCLLYNSCIFLCIPCQDKQQKIRD